METKDCLDWLIGAAWRGRDSESLEMYKACYEIGPPLIPQITEKIRAVDWEGWSEPWIHTSSAVRGRSRPGWASGSAPKARSYGGSRRPNSPSSSSFGPAAKKSVVFGPAVPPLPNAIPQRPSMTIAL